jgi:membrane-associated phospholipid phosphatase
MTKSIRTRCLCVTFVTAMVLQGTLPANAQTRTTPAPAPASDASRPFSTLFLDAASDFRHLRSRELVTVLAIGALAATAARHFDQPATETLSSASPMTSLLGAGETIGSARMQLAGALLTYAAGRAIGETRVTEMGADLIRANIVAQVMTAGVKLSARRGRPDGTEFSFPSGHASVSFATATVLQRHLGWKAGAPAYAMASYVAASRIHDRRHFLSDVTFGAAIGIVAGRAVTIGRGQARFAVAPMAAAGGGGVGFTWVPAH